VPLAADVFESVISHVSTRRKVFEGEWLTQSPAARRAPR
jgi:hypothetical protein